MGAVLTFQHPHKKRSCSPKTWVWIVIKTFCPLTGSFILPPLCNQSLAIQPLRKKEPTYKKWCRKLGVVMVHLRSCTCKRTRNVTSCVLVISLSPFFWAIVFPGDSFMWICEDYDSVWQVKNSVVLQHSCFPALAPLISFWWSLSSLSTEDLFIYSMCTAYVYVPACVSVYLVYAVSSGGGQKPLSL